jgi:hypothetical protein
LQEIDEVSPWQAVLGRSLSWGLSTVVFGLLPVWATFLMTMIDRDISFSKIEFLKSGGIVIFAITITVAVLVDYHLSRFRFSSPTIGLMFNTFFPSAICICGMIIHVNTVIAKNESLAVPFVINANIAIATFSLIFCLIQKAFLVSSDQRQ